MHSSRMRTAHSSSHGGGGVPASVYAGIHPPRSGLGDPLKVWAWRPPQARPLNLTLGCGPGDPPVQDILGYHLQCMLGYHPLPLCTEFLTHATENITLPKTSFAGGNKRQTSNKIFAFAWSEHSLIVNKREEISLGCPQAGKVLRTSKGQDPMQMFFHLSSLKALQHFPRTTRFGLNRFVRSAKPAWHRKEKNANIRKQNDVTSGFIKMLT